MPAGTDPNQRHLDIVEVEPSWGRRIVGIEGLRGIAATAVLVSHVKGLTAADADLGALAPVLPLLAYGLTLFFALSGFLLYRPFALALLTRTRKPDLAKYAVNRALRIYPAYLVVLLVVSLVLATANTAPLTVADSARGDRVGYLGDPLLLLLNATMLQTFVPFGVQTGIGVAWSLTVELVFYVVMPLLFLAVWALRRRGGLLAAFAPAGVMLVIGVTTKALSAPLYAGLTGDEALVAGWGGTWSAVLARSFLMHADQFAFGMAAAVLLEYFRQTHETPAHLRPWRWGILAGGLAAAITARVLDLGVFEDTVFAAACGALLFFVACPSRSGAGGAFARALDWGPIRYTGLVSYSMYLWHMSVIWLVLRHGLVVPGDTLGAFLANVVIVLAGTLALSTASYFLVERPALLLKSRMGARAAR
ncbi:acyltransferase [Microbacterium sp. CFBP9034]|uniref:acyltransferase family protein n=1 Tax=Microbacterium sp. CFBP9034 TaxID=3096540 RepID=UPI002A6B7E96|nr:acyltransferase [Microbacterium sp. CFBP9034]MDY0910373.1 acyltransferase [Microbacterium sp. CFBP9034]